MTPPVGAAMAAPRVIQPFPGDGLPEGVRLAASIMATMLFPGDEQKSKRRGAAYLLALHHYTKFGGDRAKGDEAWASEAIATRLQLGHVFQFIENSSMDDLLTQFGRGLVAGEVLSLLVWMNIHEPGSASLKKSIFLAEQIYRYGQPDGVDSRRLSESTIKRIWSEFRTVGHLWAAYAELTRMANRAATRANDPIRNDLEYTLLRMFLNVGELGAFAVNYLRHVSDFVPPHQRATTPILHWSEAWLPPASSICKDQPDLFDPANLYVGLSERAAEVLANYRHA